MNNRNSRSAASDGNSGSGQQNGRQRVRGRADADYGKKQNWFLRHKVFTIAMLSVLIVVLVVGTVVATTLNNLPTVLTNRTTSPASSTANGSTTGSNSTTNGSTAGGSTAGGINPTATDEQPPNYNFPNDVVNILILGTDADAARVKRGMNARTDCVMLASINTKTKQVSLVSVPRDTYVKIYNAKNKVSAKNRINAAFAFGGGLKKNGIPYAVNTISNFFGGVPIDHYVLFDMDFVKALIDACGGVTVDVEIDATINGVHYKPGPMTLTGAAALTYARDRHNTKGGDFGRVDHQQDVMVALLKKLQDKGNIVKKIPELFDAFSKYVTMDPDMGPLQIAALAWIAKDLKIADVKQYTVQGQCLTINGASIVVADQSNKQEILKEIFGIDYRIKSDETYSYLKGEITKLLNAGKGIVSSAQNLLNNYSEYYTSDEAADLRSAISAWQQYSSKNNADGMQDAQQDVQTQYEILKNLIDGRKALLSDAKDKISWAKGKLNSLSDYISDGDKSTINGLIDALQSDINSKNFDSLDDATSNLANTASPIFQKAQQDKDAATGGPSNTDSPTSNPTDTPTDTPAPADTTSPDATAVG